MNAASSRELDVLVVGAGLSGICAGYHLSHDLPGKSWEIVEARDTLGGTWDLFRYPGIRSDSDMYTLGFPFKPWTNPKAIADGPAILAYLKETADEFGITPKIRFGKTVVAAEWSTAAGRWKVTLRDTKTSETSTVFAKFLFVCAGYYDYAQGYLPDFPGADRFRGTTIHPQHWPEGFDHAGKRIVVIGSGATAMTLVPQLAKTAAHVVMLQRSPTYVLSAPERDKLANWLRTKLPDDVAYDLVRWKNVLLSMAFYNFCRSYPDAARKLLVKQVKKHLRGKVDVEKHFAPSYKPWDQRLCLVPDADLFDALLDGRASVVTDHIATFTEKGIRLQSGEQLEADVIVTATGLKLKFLGGVEISVDGRRIQPSETVAYKGMMASDVPNLALAIGYTNASWTLKCDLTARYVVRLLRHMDESGFTSCTPRRRGPIQEEPLLDFSSGYVTRAIDAFPRQGQAAPWRVYQNYVKDLLALRFGRLEDGVMEFAREGGRSRVVADLPAESAAT